MADFGEVIIRREGRLGHILLNRPAALNALNHSMVDAISQALRLWADDAHVHAVLVSGAGDRGLCAGGDVVSIHDSASKSDQRAARFWAAEYRLNSQIARFAKPYVAFMDGIVLGGGVGISAHGSMRIVTERTMVGMPEVTIGFTPDVGANWLLTHCPGELGTHLALTGQPVSGADAIALGLADRFVPSDQLPALAVALTTADVHEAVARFAVDSPRSGLLAEREWIDPAYAGNDAVAIVGRLAASPVVAAREAAALISSRSPTSVAVTLAALRRARGLGSLEEVLDQDYRVALRQLAAPDLAEGIRAQLIDKDRTPRWKPATLAEVTSDQVEGYFADLGPLELGLSRAG